MTDRELLEAAARAGGIALDFDTKIRPGRPMRKTELGDGITRWEPLTNDGDALRLAVKLRLDVMFFNDHAAIGFDKHDGDAGYEVEGYRDDPAAATRRAIVRAAAALDAGRMDGEKAPGQTSTG